MHVLIIVTAPCWRLLVDETLQGPLAFSCEAPSQPRAPYAAAGLSRGKAVLALCAAEPIALTGPDEFCFSPLGGKVSEKSALGVVSGLALLLSLAHMSLLHKCLLSE